MTYVPKNRIVDSLITGDASINSNEVLTLNAVNSNVGTFGSGTEIPVITVNAKGLITSVSSAATSNGFLLKAGDNMTGDLSFDSTSGRAIKIAGNYGWRDLVGDVTPKIGGGLAPTYKSFNGSLSYFAYQAGDVGECVFHVPHDYAPGTDMFIHLHWAHNGTNISGQLIIDISIAYAKGHQQGAFNPVKTFQIASPTLNIANTPIYWHRIEEVQFTIPNGSASMIDTNLLEVDGLILVHWATNTIPSITGSSSINAPFFLTIDIHYQSTGINTKNKAPNFYV